MGFKPMLWLDCWCRDFAVKCAIFTNLCNDFGNPFSHAIELRAMSNYFTLLAFRVTLQSTDIQLYETIRRSLGLVVVVF